MEATQTPTVEFTTEHGTKITLKEFITGLESRTLEAVYLDIPDSIKQSERVNQVNDALIKLVVVAVDGSPENILDRVLALNSQDTYEILNRVREITNNKKKQTSNTVT